MSITFKQGTKVYLSDGSRNSEIKISDVTASQTYQGSSQSVKTIHSPNKISRTFVTEKGRVTITFTFYLSSTIVEENVFNWAGFIKNGAGKHIIDGTLSLSDTTKNLYISSGDTLYLAEACIVENLSMTVAHNELLKCTVTCVAPDLADITDSNSDFGPAAFYALPVDTQGTPVVSDIILEGSPNLLACTLEITKNINWLAQKSMFDLNNIYKSSNSVVTELSVSGSITKVKTSDNMDYTPSSSIKINYGPTFEVYLGGCSITERWDLGTIHTIAADYVLLPDASESYLKF